MASADFSKVLTLETSPSQVLHLSPRAARIYLTRLGWTSGFAVTRQLTARARPHCRFVFLRSWVDRHASFSFTSRLRLALG
jgi:hypothetical protein